MDNSKEMDVVPSDSLVSTGVDLLCFSTLYCIFTKIYINFSKKGVRHGSYNEYN